MNDKMKKVFNTLKYFFLAIAFGITLLFIVTDVVSNKITKQTFIDTGVLTSIILYAYGDRYNKILPLIIGVVIIIISMIFGWPF